MIIINNIFFSCKSYNFIFTIFLRLYDITLCSKRPEPTCARGAETAIILLKTTPCTLQPGNANCLGYVPKEPGH